MATMDTEIRKLQPAELCELAHFLNQKNIWKELMAMVPREDSDAASLFTNEHILMIEQSIRQQQRSGADIFLSEWSTYGKKRPTCRTLLDLLIKAQFFRAADYLAVEILKGDPPARPQTGPAAAVDVSEAVLQEILKRQTAAAQKPKPEKVASPAPSWSLHYVEKPAEVVVSPPSRPSEEAEIKTDLMKFSDAGVMSDLMKFSKAEVVDKALDKLPEQMSDLMKFSEKQKDANQSWKEAQSEDIPLCVRGGAFAEPVNDSLTSASEASQTTTTTGDDSTTDTSQSSMLAVPSDSADVSEATMSQSDVIPVVVLAYNEKSDT